MKLIKGPKISSLFDLLQNPEFRHLLVLSMLIYSLLHSVLQLGASLWRQKQRRRRAIEEHGPAIAGVLQQVQTSVL